MRSSVGRPRASRFNLRDRQHNHSATYAEIMQSLERHGTTRVRPDDDCVPVVPNAAQRPHESCEFSYDGDGTLVVDLKAASA